MSLDTCLQKILESRKLRGLTRTLTHAIDLVDFSSNDYLGLSRSTELEQAIQHTLKAEPKDLRLVGSTGSRLLSGNSVLAEELER